MHKSAGRLIRSPRAYMHLAVIGGAMAIVLGSNLVSAATRTQAVSQLSTANGLVATLDPITSSEVAVRVAEDTKLGVDTSLLLTSSNLADQSVVGDQNALAKQEVMSISQSIRRTIATHKVEAGDTLEKLSKEFNVTTDTIKWANGVNSDADLAVGKELKVLPVSGVSYTVKSGDTVEMIAAKFHGDANIVREFNDVDVKGFEPGVEIVIPDGSPVSAATPAATTVARSYSSSSSSNSYYGGRLAGTSNGNRYTWGNCTWYVANRRAVPNGWGNAYNWDNAASRSGYTVTGVPRAGAIGVEYGINHVVYIESVNANGTVNISEMNWGGRLGIVHYRTVSASKFNYIY